MTPFFTVIVPTYNRSKLLHRAILSVVKQSYANWELVIVDDASLDDTTAVVQSIEDDRIRYIKQAKAERSIARNTGIAAAKGDYICFLDDDDYYLPDYLSNFAEHIQKNEDQQTILRTGFQVEEKESRSSSILYDESTHGHPVKFAAYQMCGVWSLCIPSAYLHVDQFPPDFPHWQDTHLVLRLLAKYPFQQLPTHNYVYVQHPEMGSKALFESEDILNRIELNVDAIRDLFNNYGEQLKPHLDFRDRSFLVGEKYLRNARLLLDQKQYRLAWRIFKKSLFVPSLFKSYAGFTLAIVPAIVRRRRQLIDEKKDRNKLVEKYKGNSVQCPCCQFTFSSFTPFGVDPRDNAMCPNCEALERHRFLWLYLHQEESIRHHGESLKILHFAPEKIFYEYFSKKYVKQYIPADLHTDHYPYPVQKINLLKMDLGDQSVGIVFCNHVLEHIPEDQKAMVEIYRVLKIGGSAIIQVPLASNLPNTYEDFSIQSPSEREKHFGQKDHVRVYGLDIQDRLKKAGFDVKIIWAKDYLSADLRKRYGLREEESVIVASK